MWTRQRLAQRLKVFVVRVKNYLKETMCFFLFCCTVVGVNDDEELMWFMTVAHYDLMFYADIVLNFD